MAIIKRFEHNQYGRDFVCGDVHGHFDQLRQKLAEVNFNENVDRLFLLGDLVDRGPKSDQAHIWLQKPFVHSIMGNHELLALWSNVHVEPTYGPNSEQHAVPLNVEGCAKRYWTKVWRDNGGEWWDNIRESDKPLILEQFAKLPLIIEVVVGDKKIGLIHADSYHIFDWNEFIEYAKLIPDDYTQWENDRLVKMLVWDRDRLELSRWCKGSSIQNIDHVYHGHSIVREPFHTHNVSYIDTGPNMRSGYITLVNLTQRHI